MNCHQGHSSTTVIIYCHPTLKKCAKQIQKTKSQNDYNLGTAILFMHKMIIFNRM